MKHSILLDDLYFYTFLGDGIKTGLFHKDDFADNANKLIPLYKQNSHRVNEILLLFDEVVFSCDFAAELGFSFNSRKLPIDYAVTQRLGSLLGSSDFSPVSSPMVLNQKKLKEYERNHKKVVKKIGIDIDVRYNWIGFNEYMRGINQSLYLPPSNREFIDQSETIDNFWYLTSQYLRRRFPFTKSISLRLFKSHLRAYRQATFPEIQVYLSKLFPQAEPDENIKMYVLALAYLFYASKMTENYIELLSEREQVGLCIADTQNSRQIKPSDLPKEGSLIIKILLSHLNQNSLVIPRARNLYEVIELREHKAVRDFRGTLWGWIDTLQNGNVSASEILRKEIAKANKEIKKIGYYQNISDWITYISLPVTAVEMATGIPVLGALLTVASLGLKLAEIETKKQANWLLLLQGKG